MSRMGFCDHVYEKSRSAANAGAYGVGVEVTFTKLVEKRCSIWEARREHYTQWKSSAPTPTADRLDHLSRRWESLGDGGQLRLAWPTLRAVPARVS